MSVGTVGTGGPGVLRQRHADEFPPVQNNQRQMYFQSFNCCKVELI